MLARAARVDGDVGCVCAEVKGASTYTPSCRADLPQVVEQQAGQELPSSSLACIVRMECMESTVFRAILCQRAARFSLLAAIAYLRVRLPHSFQLRKDWLDVAPLFVFSRQLRTDARILYSISGTREAKRCFVGRRNVESQKDVKLPF